MNTAKSDFLKIILERGFYQDCTHFEELDSLLKDGTPKVAYIGFDCTAESLHVGSLLQIMLLRWFQKCGHKPIVLMGGGTTKVGDPTGKDESRKVLTDEAIQKNMDGIKKAFAKYLTFGDGPTDAVMVNNDDWLSNLNYLEFLRDYGRHFTINRMLAFDSVKLRLGREQPLSFLEFNYMILQAYDFLELNRRHDCILQMGGSDQWGNIVNGVELSRRVDSAKVSGLTIPLMTTSSGAKMGKSADGAIWINEDMLSAYDFWQYWRNTEDADVGRFLKLFTELPLEEISKLEALQGAELNEAKKILANEVTRLAHGDKAANLAEETARKTFEQGVAADTLPSVEMTMDELDAGLTIVKAFQLAGLASTGGEVKRLVKGKGARLNDEVISDPQTSITSSEVKEGVIKLSSGKKKHAVIKIV